MEYVASWLVLPLLLIVTSWGLGLLVETVLGLRLRNGMTGALGFAAAMVLLGLPYRLGFGAGWGAAFLLILAAAGVLLARKRFPSSLPDRWTAASMVAVYCLYLAPVALSGTTTFAGYTFLGDTSVHFSLIDYVSDHGTKLVSLQPSSYAAVTTAQLHIGYPLGMHFYLADLRALLSTEVAGLYQPFISATIALAAGPVTHLLRSAGMGRRLSAIATVVVLCAYLPYSYALQGGMKEMGMITLVMLGGALAWEMGRAKSPTRVAPAYGLVTAAAFQIYSWGGLPWFGLMGAAVLAAALVRRTERRPAVVVAGAIALVVFLIGVLPYLSSSLNFFGEGQRLLTSSQGADRGNLIGKLPIWEAFGVWLVDDYRLLPNHPDWTYSLIGFVVALDLCALVWSVRTRMLVGVLVSGSAFAVWLLLPAGIYIEGKLLVILCPTAVLMAALGALALWRRGEPFVASVLAVAVSIGILASDAMAYHGLYLAPAQRLEELQHIGQRFSGQGPAMLDEFEEYGKHYLRDLNVTVPFDAWVPDAPQLRNTGLPVYAHYYDLDDMTPSYVERFPLIVTRRSPVASRPPAAYRLALRGRYYEVWQRGRGQPFASDHFPLGNAYSPVTTPRCADVHLIAIAAAAHKERLVAPEGSEPIALPVRRMDRPPAWKVNRNKSVVPVGQGRARTRFTSKQAHYQVWIRGSFGRGADVRVDGQTVGQAKDIQTPGQMSLAGSVSLPAGTHQIELVRQGRTLAPGNGRDEYYETVFLAPDQEAHLVTVRPARFRSLCGRQLDWIERLK